MVDLNELLGCTGIILDEPPATLEERGYKQTRPAKPLKLPKHGIGRYQGESEEQAKERWLKREAEIQNWQQRKCSRIDAFVSVDDDDHQPYLYVIFPQLKGVKVKANPLHAALLGHRSPQGQDRIGMKGKIVDKLLLTMLCRDNNNAEGKPTWDAWYDKKNRLIVRFPIGARLYSDIPLYEESVDSDK